MRLHAPDPQRRPGREQFGLRIERQAPRQDGAGYDRAEAFHGEDAVDGHPEVPRVTVGRNPGQPVLDRLLQLVDPLSRRRRNPDDRRVLQERTGHEGFHVLLDEHQPFLVDEVAFRQDDDARVDAHVFHRAQVFDGLGHDPFVGGHDEQDEMNPAHARDHGLEEPLVARHVHDGDFPSIAHPHEGESEIDGHAPVPLLLEAVGMNAREGLDQRALAVVDVARRAYGEMGHDRAGSVVAKAV